MNIIESNNFLTKNYFNQISKEKLIEHFPDEMIFKIIKLIPPKQFLLGFGTSCKMIYNLTQDKSICRYHILNDFNLDIQDEFFNYRQEEDVRKIYKLFYYYIKQNISNLSTIYTSTNNFVSSPVKYSISNTLCTVLSRKAKYQSFDIVTKAKSAKIQIPLSFTTPLPPLYAITEEEGQEVLFTPQLIKAEIDQGKIFCGYERGICGVWDINKNKFNRLPIFLPLAQDIDLITDTINLRFREICYIKSAGTLLYIGTDEGNCFVYEKDQHSEKYAFKAEIEPSQDEQFNAFSPINFIETQGNLVIFGRLNGLVQFVESSRNENGVLKYSCLLCYKLSNESVDQHFITCANIILKENAVSILIGTNQGCLDFISASDHLTNPLLRRIPREPIASPIIFIKQIHQSKAICIDEGRVFLIGMANGKLRLWDMARVTTNPLISFIATPLLPEQSIEPISFFYMDPLFDLKAIYAVSTTGDLIEWNFLNDSLDSAVQDNQKNFEHNYPIAKRIGSDIKDIISTYQTICLGPDSSDDPEMKLNIIGDVAKHLFECLERIHCTLPYPLRKRLYEKMPEISVEAAINKISEEISSPDFVELKSDKIKFLENLSNNLISFSQVKRKLNFNKILIEKYIKS